MRKKLGIVVLMAALAGIIFLSQTAGERLYEQVSGKADAGNLVVIDSGHGGKDPGKVGVNGVNEADVNLKIAQKLKKILEAQGVTVIMTREDEGSLAGSKSEDMQKRVSIINEKKPALAVSVHQNSYSSEEVHGAQVFYYTNSAEGGKAARIMQEALLDVDGDNKRKEKANDTYYMLKRTDVPVIIVECGFLSNRAEADLLVTEEYQDWLAEAIAKGILEYMGK
ncbi:MAG: N-acetylmuramoyl-L-alanine amidase [Ruminococcus sp.]|nr:N-acetylmuramoyl-L-alanine amidase [Ruminococcus sp.]